MGQIAWVRLWCEIREYSWFALVSLTLPGLLAATPVGAQAGTPSAGEAAFADAQGRGPRPMCMFRTEPPSEGVPQQRLYANCGGRGLPLGPAQTYEAFANPALKATLVDLRNGEDRRILLISLGDDGVPLVEDLSGQLALAAGRGPMSELADVKLDLGRFVQHGEIGVGGGSEDTGPARVDTINLGQQIALERSRRGARAPR
jgi:hypothetical protein